jgi:urease accessory protein
MQVSDPKLTAWRAHLALGFERRGDTTVLARREHFGPLRVQKALYPEGQGICHAILLHPPSGVAGGDQLDIVGHLGDGAHVLLTTPGAGRWYRSAGAWAGQRLDFRVGDGAVLEWLPQETVVFDAARAEMRIRVDLGPGARYLGWEVLCLGRRASGERFERGEVRLESRVVRAGRPIWLERGRLAGGSALLHSPAGLAGYGTSATLLAVGPGLDSALADCRAIPVQEDGALAGVTVLPELLVARYLGHGPEAARRWLVGLWGVLRPALMGVQARPPRIWNT